ncbi:MAG: ATP-grasp domain-containing protein [Ignavibacteriae bacterium]|nr:ATP-grasp domain-containing protein [Ignavibacteriota bacterium]
MNIAVTGLNAHDNPGPGVPVIRSILESGEFTGRIIGLAYDSLEPGIYLENIAAKSYMIPYPSAGLDALYDRIAAIHSKEHIDVIIPTLDSELYGFVKLADKLRALGIRTFLPTFDQLNLRAKDKLFDFCSSHGVKVPKNHLITTAHDLYMLQEKFEYPIVVKGIFYEASVAHSFNDVMTAFEKFRAKWGLPIIIQEYVGGDEFNVVALGDGTGATVGAVAMRKLYITDKGKGWAGVSIDDKKLIELAQIMMQKLQWRSGMELEFMKEKETGEYYLLEINPRFPAWVYLATATGQNLPYALVKLAYGERVAPFTKYDVGTIFVRYSWDMITKISEFEKLAMTGER